MPTILFINRVYPPDSGATGQVLERVAGRFLAAGWDVSILTTTGDHSKKGIHLQDGVKVIRVALPFSKKSLMSRAFGYVLMIPSLLLKAMLLPRSDVVVTMTDPPMLLIVGSFLKFLKGSRTIHWAQDLYPEVAEELGILRKGGVVAGILRKFSTQALGSHDLTIAVGRCMEKRLKLRGISRERMRIVPNAGIAEKIVPLPREGNAFRRAHGLEEALVVMYSGNMGRAHDFDPVLEAARQLQDQGEHSILFLFVGNGPGELFLREEARRSGLRNIRFLPPQPPESLSESLAAGDLHLVTMKPEMLGLVVPSKFYGVMAAARPCLFIGPEDSEVARVIREYGVGTVIRPGEGRSLARVILRYLGAPETIQKEGSKAARLQGESDHIGGMIRYATDLLPKQDGA